VKKPAAAACPSQGAALAAVICRERQGRHTPEPWSPTSRQTAGQTAGQTAWTTGTRDVILQKTT
jgi:hypothetical protein